MKHFAVILLFILINAISPDTYLGKWKLTGGSVIEIYRKGNFFEGRIIQRSAFPLYNRDGLDNNNPNQKLRKRAIVGLIILKNLSFENGKLLGGSIYNSDSGKTYKVNLLINENNTNVCQVTIFSYNQKMGFKIKRMSD